MKIPHFMVKYETHLENAKCDIILFDIFQVFQNIQEIELVWFPVLQKLTWFEIRDKNIADTLKVCTIYCV